MTSATTSGDAHPYLRAASAGVRHHTRALAAGVQQSAPSQPADRLHLDVLHAHVIALHRLLDHIATTTRPPHPGAGRHLSTAATRLWQSAAALHDAFHLVPAASDSTPEAECHPERLPEGPAVLTICQRHLAAGHIVRRTTTPADLNAPLHGHTTTCSQ